LEHIRVNANAELRQLRTGPADRASGVVRGGVRAAVGLCSPAGLARFIRLPRRI